MTDPTIDSDLPVITCDEDWLDLNIGDKAIIRGKTRITQGKTMVVFVQPDWSGIVTELTDEGGAQLRGLTTLLDSQASAFVERIEDGIQTSMNEIYFTG